MPNERSSGHMTSPKQLLDDAKRVMLDGREPASRHDWQLIMNFVAGNITEGLETQVCGFFKMLYPECMLTKEECEEIGAFQAQAKKEHG